MIPGFCLQRFRVSFWQLYSIIQRALTVDCFGIADSSSLGVGELEITPVSAAIARYLGIDLTAEGRAARNRRGIALVVHGAPLSGKTATAVSLAKMYGAALLTVDGVVIDAISSGNTSAGEDVLVLIFHCEQCPSSKAKKKKKNFCEQ